MPKSSDKSYLRIPKEIWALGLVSLFMDISSELIHSLLPIFMVSVLATSVTSVGVIEGVAEATALITKIFSGVLSDYLGKRKLLVLIGYSLAAFTKPLFPLADTLGLVLTARFIDRIGKGIRGAPRDALISEIAPPGMRGACFGLRQSLDTVGAFIGPVLAVVFMFIFAGNIRMVFWIAVIPAFIAVAILVFGVKEPEGKAHPKEARSPIRLSDIRHINSAYWRLVAIAGLLSLARFSEAFLVLKAQATNLPIAWVPMVMVVMSVVYSISAYPAGALSDRIGRKGILLIGIALLVAADIVLGFATDLWLLALGVCLWGLHMGFTQGLLSAMVTDTTPPEQRGTAYGIYGLVSGIAMLCASVIAGVLWDQYGAPTTFFASAVFASLTLVWLLFTQSNDSQKPQTGSA